MYNSPKEIDWDILPQRFAIKWNFGCGYNLIVQDKSKLDTRVATKQLKRWGRRKAWLGYSEMQYKDVEKKIIIEKFLIGKSGGLPEDYKIYCFNGNPTAILYINDRDSKSQHAAFFDQKWNYLGEPLNKDYKPFSIIPEAPKSLQTMIRVAEILSQGFPFVRVDFYDVDGIAIFGEMTFTPAGCSHVSEIDINGVSMGDLLIL